MQNLTINSKPVGLQKAFKSPDFNSKTVLVRDHWDYVEMYLKRKHSDNAIFYWLQAKEFYRASLNLPNISAPLTLYYCFLNATKALLSAKGMAFQENHGVAGQTIHGNTNLENEQISFYTRGVLFGLSSYLEDPSIGTRHQHSFKNLLYNLPWLHRAFVLTYTTHYPEIYIPIVRPGFLINNSDRTVRLSFSVVGNYANGHTLRKLISLGYTKDEENSWPTEYRMLSGVSINWPSRISNQTSNHLNLTACHKQMRRGIQYIFGTNTLWYIKRINANNTIDKHPLTIIFACMHRLSELARYNPLTLANHFRLQQNWLLTEFIKGAPMEFIDQISCEITNQNFMQPAVRYPN